MSAYDDLLELPVGTEIEGRRRLRVTGGSLAGLRTYLCDVESGREFSASSLDDPGSWTFTVVKPAPKKFKVGDVIHDYDYEDKSLPLGTVAVRSDETFPLVKTSSSAWTLGPNTDPSGYWSSPREIVYLPE